MVTQRTTLLGPRPNDYPYSENRLHLALILMTSRVSQAAYNGFSPWWLLREQPIAGPRPDGYPSRGISWKMETRPITYSGFSPWQPNLHGDSSGRPKLPGELFWSHYMLNSDHNYSELIYKVPQPENIRQQSSNILYTSSKVQIIGELKLIHQRVCLVLPLLL